MQTIKYHRLTPERIKKLVKKGEFNIKTPRGFIYLVGGILSKLEDDVHYIDIGGRWVKC